MSTFNHPTRIDHRSTSDVENPYFRAWALRSSEGSSSSGRGAATTSPTASPKSTSAPRALPQGKIRRVERHSLLSEGSISSPSVVHSPLPIAGIPTSTLPNNLQEDSNPPEGQPSSVRASISGSQQSGKSSLTARAQKLFSISFYRARENTDQCESSLPEPRREHQVKRGSAGSWIEGHLGKKRPSVDKAEAAIHESKVVQSPILEGHHMPLTGPRMTQTTSPKVQPPPEKAPASPAPPKGGFYSLTKLALGIKKGSVAKDSVSKPSKPHTEQAISQTVTGEILEKTSSALRKWNESGGRPGSRLRTHRSTTSNSSLSIASMRWRNRISPWSSGQSSMNSYISVPPGKAPAPTPDPQSVYTGSDDRQYLAVQITDPEGPTFLPSEAQRISIPPVFDRFEGRRKARGFFFDYAPPEVPRTPTGGLAGDAPVTQWVPEEAEEEGEQTPTQTGVTPVRNSSEKEWYRAKIDAIEAEQELSKEEEFVRIVPDHLPNSPMCPRNPRHVSGGKEACIYHGRNPAMGAH